MGCVWTVPRKREALREGVLGVQRKGSKGIQRRVYVGILFSEGPVVRVQGGRSGGGVGDPGGRNKERYRVEGRLHSRPFDNTNDYQKGDGELYLRGTSVPQPGKQELT